MILFFRSELRDSKRIGQSVVSSAVCEFLIGGSKGREVI